MPKKKSKSPKKSTKKTKYGSNCPKGVRDMGNYTKLPDDMYEDVADKMLNSKSKKAY